MTTTLQAALDVAPTRTTRPETLQASARLVNRGSAALSVIVTPMTFPGLALEVTTADGTPVPLPPPPVPGGPVEAVRLAPGADYRIDYAGFLPAWVSGGSYRVRFRYSFHPEVRPAGQWSGVVTSPWVDVDIVN